MGRTSAEREPFSWFFYGIDTSSYWIAYEGRVPRVDSSICVNVCESTFVSATLVHRTQRTAPMPTFCDFSWYCPPS